tara:strand:+ start:87 stop:851 length:765 start_codon:yes stop_codon:yes gene_type:complete
MNAYLRPEIYPSKKFENTINYTVYKNLGDEYLEHLTFANVIMFDCHKLGMIDIYKSIYSSKSDELLFNQFTKYRNLIAKTSQLSEIINYNIDTIIRLYLQKNKFKDVVQRNSKCRELSEFENTHKFDFIKFAKLLSCILNTDKDFRIIEQINTKDKIKYFTGTLYSYILDRNYYTHGYLMINKRNYQPILSILENASDYYVFITDKLLNENFKAFKYIENILVSINKVCVDLYDPNKKNSNEFRIESTCAINKL